MVVFVCLRDLGRSVAGLRKGVRRSLQGFFAMLN